MLIVEEGGMGIRGDYRGVHILSNMDTIVLTGRSFTTLWPLEVGLYTNFLPV